MIRTLPIETLKMCGGLTFGAKPHDSVAFSSLVVPAQYVLYGCFLSSPRAQVASRWALVMLVLSPRITPKYCRGSSCLEIITNDDDASFCPSGPYPTPVAPDSRRS